MRFSPVHLVTAFILLLAGVLLPCYGEEMQKKKSVLILNSMQYGDIWTDSITEGIISVLQLSEDFNIEIDVEFMDFIRFDREEYRNSEMELLKQKHAHSRYDLIITVNNSAFQMMLDRGEEIFPGTPFVFCGVFYLQKILRDIEKPITGINEAPDFIQGVELIKKIFPQRKHIHFITDMTEAGQIIGRELDWLTLTYTLPGYHYTIHQDYSRQELVETLNALGKEDVVYLAVFSRDNQWNYYDIDDSINLVTREAGDVPVFGIRDYAKDCGTVGGYLLDGTKTGSQAAALGLRILGGESPESTGIIWESPHSFYFDYNKIAYYSIPRKSLPEDTILLNKPTGIFYQYKKEIIFTLSFIAVLILVILELLRINRSEKRFRNALKRERDTLDQKVEERTRALQKMQKKIIFHERQAATGSMLAGMAHEMNTPLGVAVTSVSHLQSSLKSINQKLEAGDLTHEQFDRFMQDCSKGLKLSSDGLSKTSFLIDEFKTLAPPEAKTDISSFNLKNFFNDIDHVYRQHLEMKGITLLIGGTDQEILSYTGILYRIMNALIQNTIEYAFPLDWISEKKVFITWERKEPDDSSFPLTIYYRDTGQGIPPQIRECIFEPFTTTSRSKGKIGLGLHRVYKLVTEKLLGSIEYREDAKGTKQYIIELPESIDQ